MMETLMQQMAADNPKLLAVMQMMKQQQSDNQESQASATDLSVSLKKEKYKRRKLIQAYQALLQDAEVIEGLLDELAAGLGACPSCWGTNTECDMCEGNGKPGTYQPDKELFQHYVLPVLKNTPWIKQMFIQGLNN